MLIHPTAERLRALGLTAMADAFLEMQDLPEAAGLSREDWLGLLADPASSPPAPTDYCVVSSADWGEAAETPWRFYPPSI